ncbi:MAG TPA: hypothetical protein VI032_16100 [Burkholderiaceae bacterium]
MAIVVALLGPSIGHAGPILHESAAGYSDVRGWSNASGSYAVDFDSANFLSGFVDRVSYSTASSLYSVRSDRVSFSDGQGLVPAEMRIDARIQGNGTPSGHLLGGALTVFAGAAGIPAWGIAPNQPLLVGHALDAAALPGIYDTALLFQLTYTNPVLSGLGGYLTYFHPDVDSWTNDLSNTPLAFQPWAHDFHRTHTGFTFWDLYPTFKVPEPASFLLVGTTLLVFGVAGRLTRRTKDARPSMTALQF